jgi:hypothetical protein
MREILVAIAVLLTCASSAAAHQLDEYLQATRIAIEADRIGLEINLTPGVAVAEQIFASIDRDGDTRVSGPEIAAYGHQVLQDLALDIDGHSLPLTLVHAEFPAWAEMRDGIGTIRLAAACEVPVTRGHHRLEFVNHHRPDISVYLVNALMPSRRTISIRGQERDVRQHGIGLDFDRNAPYTSAAWILFPLVGVAVVLYRRRDPSSFRECPASAARDC